MTGHGNASFSQTSLPNFILLYALMYGAFGAASPFLPAFVEERGIPAELIGVVFGAATAIRLISAPLAGRLADRMHALRLVLAVCAIGTALAATGYLAADGFWALLAVSLLHATALAPTTNLADALALVASRRSLRLGFEYGWVRGAGSAAFIIVSMVAGWAAASQGLSAVIWMQAALMVAVPLSLLRVPAVDSRSHRKALAGGGILELLRLREFRLVVLAAAFILGSHALHDTFSVIRWRAAGIAPLTISLLWSLSVAAEVVVFFFIGPWLLHRIPAPTAIGFAAIAGGVRWLVAALTTDVWALALIQPLHGITFALLHLACMRLLAKTVPDRLAATAQAVYGTVGVGVATASLTVVSGVLYANWGGAAFAIMSGLCLVSLSFARGLREA